LHCQNAGEEQMISASPILLYFSNAPYERKVTALPSCRNSIFRHFGNARTLAAIQMTLSFSTILTAFVVTLPLALIGHSPTSNPCISTINIMKQRFSINEPIPISYKITNVSKDTVRIWHCGFWCNNRIVVMAKNKKEVARTEWGKIGLSTFSPGGDRNKNFPIILAPYETDSEYAKYNLRDQFLLTQPGVYAVTYFYDEIDGKDEIKIESNTLTITINE
jgi:hypothetical protein